MHQRGAQTGEGDREKDQMIVKRGGKYLVVSESTGRRFGTYDTLAEAKKRLQQIEIFKHLRTRGAPRRRRRPSA